MNHSIQFGDVYRIVVPPEVQDVQRRQELEEQGKNQLLNELKAKGTFVASGPLAGIGDNPLDTTPHVFTDNDAITYTTAQSFVRSHELVRQQRDEFITRVQANPQQHQDSVNRLNDLVAVSQSENHDLINELRRKVKLFMVKLAP